MLEAFLSCLVVHCDPLGYPFLGMSQGSRLQILAVWRGSTCWLVGSRMGDWGLAFPSLPTGGVFSGAFLLRGSLQCPLREWPAVIAAEQRVEAEVWWGGGESGDFHWSCALGRPALCLVFPTLKPLGFCSLRKQSSVSHGERQWLATGNTLSATPTPGARASASMRAKWPVVSRWDFPLTSVNSALSSVF